MNLGTAINEFSIDVALAGNSDDAVPTEKAVKAYVDALPAAPVTSVAGKTGVITLQEADITDLVHNPPADIVAAAEAEAKQLLQNGQSFLRL